LLFWEGVGKMESMFHKSRLSEMVCSTIFLGVFFLIFTPMSLAAKEILLKDPIGSEWEGALIGEKMTFPVGTFTGEADIQIQGPGKQRCAR